MTNTELPSSMSMYTVSYGSQERAGQALELLSNEPDYTEDHGAVWMGDTLKVVLKSPPGGRGCSKKKPRRWVKQATKMLERIAKGRTGNLVFYEKGERFLVRQGALDLLAEVTAV